MAENRIISDALLDRLVDGELSQDEERQLLRGLDSVPGEWRRCALAFVEAAAFKRELGGLAGEGLSKSTTPQTASPADVLPAASQRVHATSRRRIWPLAALAASILVAFAAGRMLPQARRAVDPTQNVAVHSNTATPAQQLANVLHPEQAKWPNVLDPSQVMSLVVTRPDGSVRPVLVPLVDEDAASRLAGGITEAGIQSALPHSVRRQLEDAGYAIQQRRRYAPLPLDGGRRLIVPVEDTQIVPVRAGVY
jgi:hypothetical protein